MIPVDVGMTPSTDPIEKNMNIKCQYVGFFEGFLLYGVILFQDY